MIGRTIGRYRVLEKLGEGGMATVWKAEDSLLRRAVALKILHPELAATSDARQRFLREARAASALDHPSIAAVHDAGEQDGILYIAFSCVLGETLSTLAARAPMAVGEVLSVGIGVTDALAHAHAHGIVHRDVTGRNVMVHRDGRVVVLDFGLALHVDGSHHTTSRALMGTVGYIAPEVARNLRADVRSDLYGVGVVLYEALTGTLPFTGAHRDAVLYSVIHEPPPALRERRADVPPELDHIVGKALEKDPALRYQSAEEMLVALRAVTAPQSPPPPRWRPQAESQEAGTQGALPREKFLLVLPFNEHGSDSTPSCASPLGEGLAESLRATLSRSDHVRIVPASGVPADLDDPALGRQLGANLILRGSMRRASMQLRVSFTLVDPHRALQVGADTVEGSTADLFDLEDRLAASVLAAMGLGAASVTRPLPPRDPAAQEHYVQALGYLQRFDDEASVNGAVALLERLAAGEPDSAVIHAALARAYLSKYRLTSERALESKAADACARALALDPRSLEVLLAQAEVFRRIGRYDDAVAIFERVLEQDSENYDAWIGIAAAHEGAGRIEATVRACREAIARRPGSWDAYNQLGFVFFRHCRYAEAAEAWEQFVRLAPQSALAHRNLGTAYFRLERLDEALRELRRSIEIQPNDNAYSSLGAILFYLGQYEEAAKALEKGTALRPTDARMWGNLGSAFRFIPGREARADEALDRAIALTRERLDRNPNEAVDWGVLAGYLANRSRIEEAEDAIERSLAAAPEDGECMGRAGSIYYQIGRREDGLRWLGEAVKRGFRLWRLERDPHLVGLRQDPEFERLLRESRRDAGTLT
jgi:serine/threonine protein kinase/tetratricopeptide (TPR) repeat protein